MPCIFCQNHLKAHICFIYFNTEFLLKNISKIRSPINTNKAPIYENEITISATWKAAPDEIDINMYVVELNKNNKYYNTVYFNKLVSPGISFIDDMFLVELSELPEDICSILFILSIFDAKAKKQNFDMVKSINIHLKDDQEKELSTLELKEHDSSSISIIAAELNKTPVGWFLHKIDKGYRQDIKDIIPIYNQKLEVDKI